MLAPDLDAGHVHGTVDVAVDVAPSRSTSSCCNAVDLEIDEAWVVDATGATASTPSPSSTPPPSASTWACRAPSGRGAVTLHLRFRGVLNDQLRGFYRSTYTDADGATPVIATTQIEATDCRRAFPCWDEPDFKAVLRRHPRGRRRPARHLRTRPRSRTQAAGDGQVARSQFADTMLMSTYLVAFVVGQLEATDPVDVDGVPLRVVHVPGKARARRRSPSRVGAFALRWFQDYYGIPYPATKVDLVALPDFAFGAMENLGLHHLPRGRPPRRPRHGDAAGAPAHRRRRRRTSSPTCGSATSSP